MAKRKRMRLPNGFGQISELKGQRLRKRFRAMVTVGKTETGRPICKLLKPVSYFSTYNEAYTALLKYHEDPTAIDKTKTMQELFDEWYEKYEAKGRSKSMLNAVRLSWTYCETIHGMKVQDVRVRHMKPCIEGNLEKKPTKFYQQKIKILLHQLLNYAIEQDLIEHNYANDIGRVDENPAKYTIKHTSFTDEEIAKLWNSSDPVAKMVLIQCYSGWRPQELIRIELEDVNIDDWTFVGGMKTKNGIRREIPIHSAIKPLIKEAYDYAVERNLKYLFANPYDQMNFVSYNAYRHQFHRSMKQAQISGHMPHDGRKHFEKKEKKKGCDEYAIKRIVGHSISDLTERVYTERDIDWLRSEIEKIPKVL